MHLVLWALGYLFCGIMCVAVHTFINRLQKPNCNLKVSEDEVFICAAWPVVGFGISLYLLVMFGEWLVQFVVNFSASLADRLRNYIAREQ
jgi:hypothetical protein